jgi:hypothetical protein
VRRIASLNGSEGPFGDRVLTHRMGKQLSAISHQPSAKNRERDRLKADG